MSKQLYPNFRLYCAFLCNVIFYCLYCASTAIGQHIPPAPSDYNYEPDRTLLMMSDSIEWADESIFRKQLERNGLSQAVIDKLVEQHKQIVAAGRKDDWKTIAKLPDPSPAYGPVNPPPKTCSVCSDMGGESGWNAWKGAPGRNVMTPPGAVFSPPGAPTAPRFNITGGLGIDPLTPGLAAGSPPIPIVAPGFGTASLQIGEPQVNGSSGGCSNTSTAGCAERIIYPLTVSAQDTNFVYAYAFIMENPGSSHTYVQMPYVEFVMLNARGDTVPCSYQHYVGSDRFPGQFVAKYMVNGPTNPVYKPWTFVGVNLSAYVGQTITVIVTNADCSQGGHFAHSYWDFLCGPLSTSITAGCKGAQRDTLIAPASEPFNPYTYEWHRNGSPNIIGTSQIITPMISPGDTFTVKVTPMSGCGFYVVYVPQPFSVTADFSFSGNCNSMTFTDGSTSSNSSSPVTKWQWSFPGGNPSSSNSQNPGVVTYPAGTYTVTLIAISSKGCSDTLQKTISVGAVPTAAFTSTAPCLGGTTTLQDGSMSTASDPITSWSWTMTGGSPSTALGISTSTIYNTAGVHLVNLMVYTQQGCWDSITKQVTVYNPPIALFNDRDSGCTPVCHNFTDLSQAVDGSITNWQWSFTGSVPASSTSQNPVNICFNNPGVYDGSLIVTTNYGCKDTIKLIEIIHAYPWPTADFTSTGKCGAMQFTDKSTTPDPAFPVTTWQWSFPGGTPSSSITQNPGTITYPPGNYTATLQVSTSTGCSKSIQHTFNVGAFPKAAFTSTSPCLGAATTLRDSSVANPSDPINMWNWTMTGGTPAIGTGNSTSTLFNTAGLHTVNLLVITNQGCRDSISKQVLIHDLPVALFNDRDSGCAPVCHNFKDLSLPVDGNITNWQWSFPGSATTSSILQNPANICYSNPGVYDGSLIVTTNYGCKDTIQLKKIIRAYPWPKAEFTSSGVCGLMNFKDKSTTPDPAYPVAVWNWSFPGGTPSTSTLQNPGVITYSPGSYTATFIVTSSTGCTKNIQHTLNVVPFPKALFTVTAPCLGASTALQNNSVSPPGDPISSWSWTMTGGTPPAASGNNASTVYSSAGNHPVTLIVTTRNGCKDTVSQQVLVYNKPIALFDDKASGCTPVCHTFRDLSKAVDGTIATWQWNFPGGSPSTADAPNPNICFDKPGVYNGSLTVTTNYGCKADIKLNEIIHAFPWPTADFSQSSERANRLKPVFSFNKLWSSDVTKWRWNFGDGSPIDSLNSSPVHSYADASIENDFYAYPISLYVQNQYGCWDTISRRIELDPEFSFYIPNTFTPNGDRSNEYFFGKGRGIKDYTIWIFNRWGSLLWTCHYDGPNTDWDGMGQEGMPSSCKWDGVFNGSLVQEDVYVWKVKFQNIFNKNYSDEGTVTVVK